MTIFGVLFRALIDNDDIDEKGDYKRSELIDKKFCKFDAFYISGRAVLSTPKAPFQ